MTVAYAEISVTTNFSFLHGASHPKEFAAQATLYGLNAIGIADRNTLAGVVRLYDALSQIKDMKPRQLVGARLVFVDGTPDILVYPTDRAAYGRLCRLLSEGKMRAPKGACILMLDDLLRWQEGLLLVVMPPHPGRKAVEIERPEKTWNLDDGLLKGISFEKDLHADPKEIESLLKRLSDVSPGRVWLGVYMPYRGDDQRRLRQWQEVARPSGK